VGGVGTRPAARCKDFYGPVVMVKVMELHAGCSSWTSDAWSGRFYPAGIKGPDRLPYYARYFDCVEVDATYYAPPSAFVVRAWHKKTPETFRFTLKFPRDLMDPKKPLEPDKIAEFVQTARLLGGKLGPIVLQFAPWFRPTASTETGTAAYLRKMVEALPEGPEYAVELRDPGWFAGPMREWVSSLLERSRIAGCWSSLNYLDVPPLDTTDWVYLRFIGDHVTIPGEAHGEIRADRSEETRRWVKRLHGVEASRAWVFFNNHYAGYAPESVNLFRQEMGLEPLPLPHAD
jgi:uncharacterized protein YecE (DUF72 family)